MRPFGIERFVVEPVAHPHHQVGLLGVAQGYVFPNQPVADHLADVHVAHHHDGQAVASRHLLRNMDRVVGSDGIVYHPVGMHHQGGYAERNPCEEREFDSGIMLPHPSGEPRMAFVRQPQHLDDKERHGDVERGDVPRVADIVDRDQHLCGQLLNEEVAKEKENQLEDQQTHERPAIAPFGGQRLIASIANVGRQQQLKEDGLQKDLHETGWNVRLNTTISLSVPMRKGGPQRERPDET